MVPIPLAHAVGAVVGLLVLKLMREIKGITFYDSCYHALALQMKGVYVTADREYVKKAERKGHLALLPDWRIPGRP